MKEIDQSTIRVPGITFNNKEKKTGWILMSEGKKQIITSNWYIAVSRGTDVPLNISREDLWWFLEKNIWIKVE